MPRYQVYGLIVLLKLLALLPIKGVRFAGSMVGRLLYLMRGRARSTTEVNIALCFPHLRPLEQKRLVKQSLIESAKLSCEMAAVWLWDVEKALSLIKTVRNEELISTAYGRGKGVILMAPHLGNWEIIGLFLGKKYPTTILYQPAKSAPLDKLIYQARTRNGTHVVPTNRKGIVSLLKTVKAGQMIAILPDQEPERDGGVFAPFFNTPALTMTLLSGLAHKSNATVVCVFAKRREDLGGFELVFMPVDPAVASKNTEQSATALNQAVERAVLDAPEQYQWEYKRFKKRPNHEPRFYPKGR